MSPARRPRKHHEEARRAREVAGSHGPRCYIREKSRARAGAEYNGNKKKESRSCLACSILIAAAAAAAAIASALYSRAALLLGARGSFYASYGFPRQAISGPRGAPRRFTGMSRAAADGADWMRLRWVVGRRMGTGVIEILGWMALRARVHPLTAISAITPCSK